MFSKDRFIFKNFFSGKIEANGVLLGFSGLLKRRIHIDMEGKWQKNKGQLLEKYIYDDGENERRVWDLHYEREGRIIGHGEALVGKLIGEECGHSFRAKYILELPVGGLKIRFSLDDSMHQVSEDTVINYIRIKKFGITLATLHITLKKHNR